MVERAAGMQVRSPCAASHVDSTISAAKQGETGLRSLLRANPTQSSGLCPERDSDTLKSRLAGNGRSWTSLEKGRCVET